MERLTERQQEYLWRLSKMTRPWDAFGPEKAMLNKLLKRGLARWHSGYPSGFTITPAGRAALHPEREG